MLTISGVLCSSLLLMQLAGPPDQPGVAYDLRANQLFKAPGIGAEAPAFQPAPEEERKRLDGLWDVVEVSFMGQVWIARGSQVMIENGKWLGFDPHARFDNVTGNIRGDFIAGTDQTCERTEIEGKTRYRRLGRYKLDGDRLWLALGGADETPVRAIPTVVEPEVIYYHLQRRSSKQGEGRAKDHQIAPGFKNTTLANSHSIESVTRLYNYNTAILRRDLFQPPIPDLTIEQMKAGLKLAAEAQIREGKPKTAKTLTDLAENGVISNRIGELIIIGTHGVDENGGTLSRLIVPTFLIVAGDKIEPDGADGESTEELVAVTSLSLIYEQGGYVSKKFEDPAIVQFDVPQEK
jgi:hypothetical protein